MCTQTMQIRPDRIIYSLMVFALLLAHEQRVGMETHLKYDAAAIVFVLSSKP